jgi:MFS family permease
VLQTALVQVVWHLSDILFGPVAGVLADRLDRRRIMIVTNLLAAAVVGAMAALMVVQGHLVSVVALIAVFLLNSLTTFLRPARTAILPVVVGHDLLAVALGWFRTASQVATLLGSALAGMAIAVVGAAWAVVIDALSFVVVAVAIAVAPLPRRETRPAVIQERSSFLRSFLSEIRDGWRAIAGQPVVKALVWLGMLSNVASFLGPLYPALVRERLHADAAAYGAIEAAAVVGGMAGGAVAGLLERRLGAGRVYVAGQGLAGIGTLGIAASTWLPLTLLLEAALVFGITVGAVAMSAVTVVLVPEDYRGRVAGITTSLAVVVIPISTLIGGWLADVVGVAPLFAVGGAWLLGVAALAWSNPYVRTARI